MKPEELQFRLDTLSAHLLLLHARLILLEGQLRAVLLNQLPAQTPPGAVLLGTEEFVSAWKKAREEMCEMREEVRRASTPPPPPAGPTAT